MCARQQVCVGTSIGFDEPLQRLKDRARGFHRIRRRVHADHRIAAAVQQPLESRKQNAADIVCGVVRLYADAQHAELAHRVPAARDVADLGAGQHQILVAHNFGGRRRYFRSDRPLQLLQFRLARGIVENAFAKFAHRQALYGLKGFLIEAFKNQAGDVVFIGVDRRLLDDFAKRQIRESALRRHALAFRPSGNPRQPVAGLLLVGFRKKLAEIGKCEALRHFGSRVHG